MFEAQIWKFGELDTWMDILLIDSQALNSPSNRDVTKPNSKWYIKVAKGNETQTK